MEISEVKQRPELNISVDTANPVETFLHQNLRPILKMLNINILVNFENALLEKRINISQLSKAEKLIKCKAFLQNELVFKSIILGMVIGQFTETETTFYIENRKEISKRIHQMVMQRIVSQLD